MIFIRAAHQRVQVRDFYPLKNRHSFGEIRLCHFFLLLAGRLTAPMQLQIIWISCCLRPFIFSALNIIILSSNSRIISAFNSVNSAYFFTKDKKYCALRFSSLAYDKNNFSSETLHILSCLKCRKPRNAYIKKYRRGHGKSSCR